MTNDEYLIFVQQELQRILDTAEKKGNDYTAGRGPFYNYECATAFKVDPMIAIMIRMGDKFRRLEAFASRNALDCEPVEDALRDIIGYSIGCLGMLQERNTEAYFKSSQALEEADLTDLTKKLSEEVW